MASLPNPVIVVPGIIATYLSDQYPIPPEIWTVLTKVYERASLHPDDLLATVPKKERIYEATQPARVVPEQVYDIAYREMIEELRHNLRAKEDEPVPVFPFGYDWRQPLEAIQDELAVFIREVGRRTSLLRHYHKAGYDDDPRVNLIGHSMGGLIIAGCIAAHGAELKIGKISTLGTPFRGSFETVVKVATGTANLGTDVPSSRERESARVTPALYYLTPSFGGVTIDPGLPQTDLFDPAVWQPSIADSIAEYIRFHGRDTMNLTQRRSMARDILGAMLTAGLSWTTSTYQSPGWGRTTGFASPGSMPTLAFRSTSAKAGKVLTSSSIRGISRTAGAILTRMSPRIPVTGPCPCGQRFRSSCRQTAWSASSRQILTFSARSATGSC